MPNVQWGVDLEEVGTYAELEVQLSHTPFKKSWPRH